ncbi:MAG: COP23 domain-containing protein [Cyanobacteria bacterium P01_G01_bin.19]
MKRNLLAKTTITLSIVMGAIATGAESTSAQDRFACDTNQMSTTVQTERGSIPLIRWTDRSFPPPFTPEQRCQIVSNRFKTFHNNGTLKYIKADKVNNLPALCVAAYKGGPCLPNGLLVTLKPGTDANQTLVKILDRRVWATSGVVQLDGGEKPEALVSRVNGETYFNMEQFLNWSGE